MLVHVQTGNILCYYDIVYLIKLFFPAVYVCRLERNRERLLADTTLSNATKLDHSHMTPHASHLTEPVAPTSARNNSVSRLPRLVVDVFGLTFHSSTLQTVQSEDDALLSSVRRTLDNSLAKHLDPGEEGCSLNTMHT